MNDQTKQALSDFVQKVIDLASEAASWTSVQIPLVVQEWLNWIALQKGLEALGFLIFIALAWWARYKIIYYVGLMNNDRDREEHVNFGRLVTLLVCLLLTTITTIAGLLPALTQFLKVFVAPRIVVLEKFADIVK